MRVKQRLIALITVLVLLMTAVLPSTIALAEDRSTQVNFTVDEIQQAGVEDRIFAQAIYDSITVQPDKFLDGNTLTNNTFSMMEELLNNFTGDINGSGTGKTDAEKISSIQGVTMLKTASSLQVQDNNIISLIPLSVTNAVSEGDVSREEVTYYGTSKTNLAINITGNPIRIYPAIIGGRITVMPQLETYSIPLTKEELVFLNDGASSYQKAYDVPIDAWRGDVRPYMQSIHTQLVQPSYDYEQRPPYDIASGASFVQGSDIGGRIDKLSVQGIKNTGSFEVQVSAAKTNNSINSDMSYVTVTSRGQLSFGGQSMKWYQPVLTKIYSKIEKGNTDTKHSVSLVKLGADDNDVKAGAEYSLYKKTNDELVREKLTTDKSGLLTVNSLEAGEYYFVETKAPKGYELDPTPIAFTIENGSIDILGGSGNKLTPTDGEEQTIDGTFVLSGSDEAPASVVINEPANGVFDTLTLDWTDGNQGGTAGKVVYQLGTGTNTGETVYVASKEEAEQKALDKLKECRDLYQNVKISASFNQKIELSQVDELAVTVDKAVNKIWEDHDNQDGIRPSQVKVQLYADNKAVGDAVMLNEGNGWSYTWTELARLAEEQEIVYSVKEVDVPDGYTENVEIDKDGNFTLTNTRKQEPDKPTSPTEPEKPASPNTSKPNTPQTGDMLNREIIYATLLGFAGLLVIVGLVRHRTKKR